MVVFDGKVAVVRGAMRKDETDGFVQEDVLLAGLDDTVLHGIVHDGRVSLGTRDLAEERLGMRRHVTEIVARKERLDRCLGGVEDRELQQSTHWDLVGLGGQVDGGNIWDRFVGVDVVVKRVKVALEMR